MVAASVARLSGRALRWLGWTIAALLLAVVLYLLAAWLGSSIPRNGDWQEPTAGGVLIGVETNGVHTALVLPLVTSAKDWRRDFPLSDVTRPSRPYTHISISWGEREVFLDTPTWWDLKASTVLRVLTRGGDGLAHIAFYARPATSRDLRPIRLSANQYAALVASIEAQLPRERPMRRHPGYGASDVFYEVGGRYTAVNTCNQWTGNRLADAGVGIGRWTPLQSGVMKWAQLPASPLALISEPSGRPPQPARSL
ncbi:DUF2459 domain-containing protein [Novosphingobium sp. 9U]|uniref:DUF2459 domain-containing protein n=1 Tax=Novosphingobium sp. 9U TaxID=2653158 RepID=UPI0012EFCA98|nr:DUF2459 domain-containing protein [Novosphingobium sp. 9U]VWX52232.1 conserved hypothetical protein [Novosphingobium sp. 9U]